MKLRLIILLVTGLLSVQALGDELTSKLEETRFTAKVKFTKVLDYDASAFAEVLDFGAGSSKSNAASYGSMRGDVIVIEFDIEIVAVLSANEREAEKLSFVNSLHSGPHEFCWIGLAEYTTANGDTHILKRYASRGAADARIRSPRFGDTVRVPPPPPSASQTPQARVYSGTGWFCNGGYVITCNHVIDGKSKISVRWSSISGVPAEVVVRDKANDIAVLRPLHSGALPPGLPMAKTFPRQAERVFTVGFPHPDVQGAAAKVTDGIVSSLSGLGDDPRILQIQVPVQAGNSGGPLVNLNGEVVGIVVAKVNAVLVFALTGDFPENINFAVKSQYVEPLISGLQALPNAQSLSAGADSLENIVARIQGSIVFVTAQ